MLSKGKLLFLGVLGAVILAGVFHESLTGQIGSFGSLKSLEQTTDDVIEVKEADAGDNFHRNVIRGAIKAKRDGKITGRQLRRLRIAMISPAFREQAKELAEIQMLASDDADKIPRIGENIDWDALISFIEKLIPLIIKLIDAITAVAFGSPVDFQHQVDFDLYYKIRRVDSSRYHQSVAA